MVELEDNEKVLIEVRKHPFVILSTAAALVIALLLPLAFLFVMGAVSTFEPEAVRELTPYALFLYSIWLLVLWIFFFVEWTDYYLDVWYVTDRRVIDVEQQGIFHREVISFRYDSIQDITVETRGIVQTLMGFGDIHIQTAGVARKIVLQNARGAEEAKNFILGLHNKVRNEYQTVRVVRE